MSYVGAWKARYTMAINYHELGKRISYFRARKGLSQETLGEKIGVNNKHISNIEIGKSRPSLDSLIEIANALGISADDLPSLSLNAMRLRKKFSQGLSRN